MASFTTRAALAAAAIAYGIAAQAADITGAGATFPFPIYAKWAEAYKQKTGNGIVITSYSIHYTKLYEAEKKTLTLLIPTGSIGNMTPYVDKWKNELGIELEFIEEPDEVIHTKGMQEAVAKTGRYDVMMPTAMSYPDWIDSGVIYDLTDWVEKYDPEIFNEDVITSYSIHYTKLYDWIRSVL